MLNNLFFIKQYNNKKPSKTMNCKNQLDKNALSVIVNESECNDLKAAFKKLTKETCKGGRREGGGWKCLENNMKLDKLTKAV